MWPNRNLKFSEEQIWQQLRKIIVRCITKQGLISLLQKESVIKVRQRKVDNAYAEVSAEKRNRNEF